MDVLVLISGPGADPIYATTGAAGADLRAFLPAAVSIAAQSQALIPTGIFVAIPEGYVGDIRGRSGLALHHRLRVHSGTIDSDYRGEIQVLIENGSDTAFTVEPGARIAQLVIHPVAKAAFVRAPLGETDRQDGGFGHTGRN
ncbi:MAG: dUTP diphosphatase [Sulfobacillus sp.]